MGGTHAQWPPVFAPNATWHDVVELQLRPWRMRGSIDVAAFLRETNNLRSLAHPPNAAVVDSDGWRVLRVGARWVGHHSARAEAEGDDADHRVHDGVDLELGDRAEGAAVPEVAALIVLFAPLLRAFPAAAAASAAQPQRYPVELGPGVRGVPAPARPRVPGAQRAPFPLPFVGPLPPVAPVCGRAVPPVGTPGVAGRAEEVAPALPAAAAAPLALPFAPARHRCSQASTSLK